MPHGTGAMEKTIDAFFAGRFKRPVMPWEQCHPHDPLKPTYMQRARAKASIMIPK